MLAQEKMLDGEKEELSQVRTLKNLIETSGLYNALVQLHTAVFLTVAII